MEGMRGVEPLLIVDSCGPRASLALFVGEVLKGERLLPERSVSATLLDGVEALLRDAEVPLAAPLALGVVHGPGSFTGVRVGLAVVKGLAESAGLHVAAVSRLAVLQAVAGEPAAAAVLWAGREEVYLRDEQGNEGLCSLTELSERAGNPRLVCAQEDADRLVRRDSQLTPYLLRAADAFPLVCTALVQGGSDLRTLDAHYLREESAIYKRPGVQLEV